MCSVSAELISASGFRDNGVMPSLYEKVVTQPPPRPTRAERPTADVFADLATESAPELKPPSMPFCSEVCVAMTPKPPHDAKSQSTPNRLDCAWRRSYMACGPCSCAR